MRQRSEAYLLPAPIHWSVACIFTKSALASVRECVAPSRGFVPSSLVRCTEPHPPISIRITPILYLPTRSGRRSRCSRDLSRNVRGVRTDAPGSRPTEKCLSLPITRHSAVTAITTSMNNASPEAGNAKSSASARTRSPFASATSGASSACLSSKPYAPPANHDTGRMR